VSDGKIVKGISELLPVKLIGPMLPFAYLDCTIEGDRGYGANFWKPLSKECIKWLQSKSLHSVVYIFFGSLVSLTPQQTEEITCGLQKSNKNFT